MQKINSNIVDTRAQSPIEEEYATSTKKVIQTIVTCILKLASTSKLRKKKCAIDMQATQKFLYLFVAASLTLNNIWGIC